MWALIYFIWKNKNNWCCPICEEKMNESYAMPELNLWECEKCNVLLNVPPNIDIKFSENFNFYYFLNKKKISFKKLRKIRKMKSFL